VWQKREELSRLAVTAAVAVGGIAGQSGRGSKLGAPFDQRVERVGDTGRKSRHWNERSKAAWHYNCNQRLLLHSRFFV
jgi:hypothetical protein